MICLDIIFRCETHPLRQQKGSFLGYHPMDGLNGWCYILEMDSFDFNHKIYRVQLTETFTQGLNWWIEDKTRMKTKQNKKQEKRRRRRRK